MNSLTRFDKDGIEIIIDTQTGESFASISGYARMANLSKQAVSKRLQGVNQSVAKTAEIQTAGGLQGVNLITEDTICEWIVKDNSFMAGQLLKLGVRKFLHQLAGYQSESKEQVRQLPPKRDSIAYAEMALAMGISDDGYLKELIKQAAIDELSLSQNVKQLTATIEPTKEYTIVKVRATELGYTLKQIGTGSQLGAFVARRLKEAFKKRIGQYEVKHYEVNNELDHVINEYFKYLVRA